MDCKGNYRTLDNLDQIGKFPSDIVIASQEADHSVRRPRYCEFQKRLAPHARTALARPIDCFGAQKLRRAVLRQPPSINHREHGAIKLHGYAQPAARQRLRDAVPDYPQGLEAQVRAALDPTEAYSQVPGRDPATRPQKRAEKLGVGRNDPCPCGSGRKYKKCCLLKEEAAAAPDSARPKYRFEPGSYGGDQGAFVPSILCTKEEAGTSSVHFMLVRPQVIEPDAQHASATAAADLDVAFSSAPGASAVPEQVALSLWKVGYVIVEQPASISPRSRDFRGEAGNSRESR